MIMLHRAGIISSNAINTTEKEGKTREGNTEKVISNTRINILIAFIKVRKFKLIKKASKIKQNEKWTKLGFAKFSL